MYACICGFDAELEGDLMSHVLEHHCRSYGLETCSYTEPTWTEGGAERPYWVIKAVVRELQR